MRPAVRLTVVILLAILIPIVPFALIGELPGERWLSATDEDALLFAITGGGLLAADVLLPIPSSIPDWVRQIGTSRGQPSGFSVAQASGSCLSFKSESPVLWR